MSEITTVLHAKRDRSELDGPAIRALVEGVTTGRASDAQLGAFTMAVCLNGMSMGEQIELTLGMRDSGQVMQWSGLSGPVLDKHSTGGVGDMVSLILGPLLASVGAFVPMISGRGLGHTGGTLDKLESIPGFCTQPGLQAFQAMVRRVGVAIIGQTGDLAPADRRLYAIRDEACTIPSIPLIVSSILSKKLAEGLDGLVLDVKTGSGAFMREAAEARELARQMTVVAKGAGLPCTALVTDMNQPLAWSAGNALEVQEAVDFFAGKRHPRLKQVTMALALAALRRGGLAADHADAEKNLQIALDSGAAAERFERMVQAQGGPPDLLDNAARHLRQAPVRRPFPAERAGWVRSMDTREIGLAVLQLGGGRRRNTDKIDPRVGLTRLCSLGDSVDEGAPLAEIHAASEADWARAAATLRAAIVIGPERVASPPCVYGQTDEDHD